MTFAIYRLDVIAGNTIHIRRLFRANHSCYAKPARSADELGQKGVGFDLLPSPS